MFNEKKPIRIGCGRLFIYFIISHNLHEKSCVEAILLFIQFEVNIFPLILLLLINAVCSMDELVFFVLVGRVL